MLAPATPPAGAWSTPHHHPRATSTHPSGVSPGGESTPVTSVNEERQEFGHYNPVFFPDGEHFAYEVGALPARLGIHVSSLTSSNTISLLPRLTLPFVVTANGFLLFVDQGVLRAQRLDLNRLETVGENVVVATGIESLSASSDGTIAYRNASSTNTQLTWFDSSGKQLGTVSCPGDYLAPMLSPDESKVAVARDGDICVGSPPVGPNSVLRMNRRRNSGRCGHRMGAKSSTAAASSGAWSRERRAGRALRKSCSIEEGPYRGAGHQTAGSLHTPRPARARFWTYMFFLVLVSASPELYLQTKFQDLDNKLSPDGKRMVYTSVLSGRSEMMYSPILRRQNGGKFRRAAAVNHRGAVTEESYGPWSGRKVDGGRHHDDADL